MRGSSNSRLYHVPPASSRARMSRFARRRSARCPISSRHNLVRDAGCGSATPSPRVRALGSRRCRSSAPRAPRDRTPWSAVGRAGSRCRPWKHLRQLPRAGTIAHLAFGEGFRDGRSRACRAAGVKMGTSRGGTRGRQKILSRRLPSTQRCPSRTGNKWCTLRALLRASTSSTGGATRWQRLEAGGGDPRRPAAGRRMCPRASP